MVLMNLLSGQQWRCRHREQTGGHEAEEGEGGPNEESSVETYTARCKVDRQWEFAVWLRERKPELCDDLGGMGWSGRWEGGLPGRGHKYTYG